MSFSIDFREYERVASNTGVYKGVELDLLKETLHSWHDSPGDPYTLLELRDGKALVTYALIGKISGRNSTYDIRYLVVDRDYRSTSGCVHLLTMIEEELLKNAPYAVIRIEISTQRLISLGAIKFEESGYKLIGHILNYYGEGDDYYYYVRTIYKNKAAFSNLTSNDSSPKKE
jgi:hypothetical protein